METFVYIVLTMAAITGLVLFLFSFLTRCHHEYEVILNERWENHYSHGDGPNTVKEYQKIVQRCKCCGKIKTDTV